MWHSLPPSPHLKNKHAPSHLHSAASSVDPEGGYRVPALQSDYSSEWLGEGEIGGCHSWGFLKLNTPTLTKCRRPSSLNRQTEPAEGPKRQLLPSQVLDMQWGTRTESEAKPQQYLKQLTTKYGKHTNHQSRHMPGAIGCESICSSQETARAGVLIQKESKQRERKTK